MEKLIQQRKAAPAVSFPKVVRHLGNFFWVQKPDRTQTGLLQKKEKTPNRL